MERDISREAEQNLVNKIIKLEEENAALRKSLSDLELHTLQFQINPHFIFNTLNAGQQIAMMEGAENTSEFLDKFASLLRYNIKKIDNPVTLMEELENVKSYTYLLKARYKDWIKVIFNIQLNIPKLTMPALIFQPLIENAFIHGIGDLEREGIISITVRRSKEGVQVIVEDNGKGMSQETIKEIFVESKNHSETVKFSEKSAGIGLRNVVKRLNLFYKRRDLVRIFSDADNGTRIVFTLPLET